jgi:hypothetical protein
MTMMTTPVSLELGMGPIEEFACEIEKGVEIIASG